ncbi:hypothetical protein [Bordetella phage vB_BbrM_PHB04]|uniref:Rad50/SbcC-type AAA domain-containing protein n=1 Tax=Bordetella phage vB_BbrM_PHB04 TaxID=2029657 RepID=A0A291LA72_9CAUD|nr:hypothetical protein HOS14_gp106 [Bordetella phage vB_BbrM_PHB04]ATI15724.1 hypothetical protein [Bordetella phage vB_BbrM_PHB04]
MHIAKIKFSNILGIAEMELSPKGFTEISGPNGSGKTSILEAIKAVLETGHDATLLRKGAEKGEAVLVLDDGTELSKTVTPTGSTSAVRRDGKKVPRPAEVIKQLTDMISVNPVDFLRAPKKDRVRVLLEAMPLEADAEKLAEIAGVKVTAAPGTHALQVIQQVHTEVYDARTGTNRAVKEKKATITQLEQAVPPVPAGADGDEAELDAALQEIDAARDAELGRISTKLDGIRADTRTKIDAIRTKLQADMDALKAAAQAEVDAINAELAKRETQAAAARERNVTTFAAQREPIAAQLGTLRQNRDLHARRAQTLETIGVMETELEELETQAERQTQALAAIEQYKSDLLNSLPIPGLEVRDGEIYRDDVQFDRLNTAQQVDVAVEIAKLRAGDLGVICVDGLESLDTESLDAFRDRALESGLQLFVTRVSDDDFSISTDD